MPEEAGDGHDKIKICLIVKKIQHGLPASDTLKYK